MQDTIGEPDDAALVVLLATNLDTHFPKLVDEYEKRIYRWAYRYVQDEASDATQRVMTNAYFALKRFPKERILSLELQSYLYRIMENECFKMLRERKRQIPDISLNDTHGVNIEDLAGDIGIPVEYVVEHRELLRGAFSKLSPKEQKVMYLRYIQDMPEAEIASVLNEPLGTVKSRISRAREKLRKMLEDLPDTEGA